MLKSNFPSLSTSLTTDYIFKLRLQPFQQRKAEKETGFWTNDRDARKGNLRLGVRAINGIEERASCILYCDDDFTQFKGIWCFSQNYTAFQSGIRFDPDMACFPWRMPLSLRCVRMCWVCAHALGFSTNRIQRFFLFRRWWFSGVYHRQNCSNQVEKFYFRNFLDLPLIFPTLGIWVTPLFMSYTFIRYRYRWNS